MDTADTDSHAVAPLCECESNQQPSAQTKVLWLEFALLVGLWLLHSAVNFWWLKIDTRPPYSDPAGHAVMTLHLTRYDWQELLTTGLAWNTMLQIQPYPPLLYLSSLPFANFFWPSVDAMLAVNTIYLGVLIFATYGIGRLLVGGRVGLLAAFLVSMYPILFGLSRIYLTDVPLTAMTALAIFCLIWSEAFRRVGPSLLFGVAIGLAMLTKWTFVAFLLGPLVIALYLVLRHDSWARVINVVLAGGLSLAVALPWYLYNWELLQRFLQNNGLLAAQLENDPAIWTLASLGYYLGEAAREQILLPYCLLFLVGAVLAIRRCQLNAYLWMLLAWVGVGYLISSLFINKDTRYTMPYLPAVALLTAMGWQQIRHVMVRRVGIALIMLYAVGQYAALTIGFSQHVAWMPTYVGWPQDRPLVTLYSERVHIADPARAENWQVDAILKMAMDDAASTGAQVGATREPLRLVVVPTAPYFDAQAFIYTTWRDYLNVEVRFVTGILAVESEQILARSDYVVTKSGDQGWDFAVQDAATITAQLLDPASPLRAEYVLLAEFPLPDQSTAHLFRHHQ